MSKPQNLLKVILHDTKTVSNAASIQILPANERRLYAEIVNASDNGIWLNLGGTATIGTGIYLAPNGFSYEINSDNLWRGSVSGRAVAGVANVVGTMEAQ